MTRIFVVALGAILASAGLLLMWQGWDIVQVERGWTQVIAGATFVGSGVVTVAVGLLIGVLRGSDAAPLRREAPPRERKTATRSDKGAARPPSAPEQAARVAASEKTLEATDAAAAPRAAEEPPAASEIVETLITRERGEHPGAWINEALAAVSRAEGAEPVGEATTGVERVLDEASGVAEPGGEGSKIVGRYTIGGVHYTLLDNGSIEGRTPAGLVRFASLDELRAHIETESRRG